MPPFAPLSGASRSIPLPSQRPGGLPSPGSKDALLVQRRGLGGREAAISRVLLISDPSGLAISAGQVRRMVRSVLPVSSGSLPGQGAPSSPTPMGTQALARREKLSLMLGCISRCRQEPESSAPPAWSTVPL